MNTQELQEFPGNKNHRLRNTSCVYCGRKFGKTLPSKKEHVVGRKFIPRGTLSRGWNLIINSCKKCNDEKGGLEKELSAISMQPDAWGQVPLDEPHLRSEAARKETERSTKTGKTVAQSQETFSVTAKLLPGLSMNIDYTAPPQMPEERAGRLARFQIGGLFYLHTYDNALGQGSPPPGRFYIVEMKHRADWGNPRIAALTRILKTWTWRWHGITAEGNFKVLLRKKDDQTALWGWAVEWNLNHRLVGLFGDEHAAKDVLSGLPGYDWSLLEDRPGRRTIMHLDTPVSEPDDLFAYP